VWQGIQIPHGMRVQLLFLSPQPLLHVGHGLLQQRALGVAIRTFCCRHRHQRGACPSRRAAGWTMARKADNWARNWGRNAAPKSEDGIERRTVASAGCVPRFGVRKAGSKQGPACATKHKLQGRTECGRETGTLLALVAGINCGINKKTALGCDPSEHKTSKRQGI
jgi:hypothetical protein